MVSSPSPSYSILFIHLNSPIADDRCAALLEVDTENRERRIRLKKKKGRMEEAQSWLEGLTRDDPNVMTNHSFSE